MFKLQEYRKVVAIARAVTGVAIDARHREESVNAVRLRLAAMEPRKGRNLRRWRAWAISGSVAATVGMAIALIVANSVSPKVVNAAEELQQSAQATKAYRGWVHITPPAGTLFPSATAAASQPSTGAAYVLKGIHINTEDGTTAIVFEMQGKLNVKMFSPAQKQQYVYVGAIDQLWIGPMDNKERVSAMKVRAELPLELADYLAQVKADGLKTPAIAETADGGLQRFELSFTDDPAKVPERYRELAAGKQTIWVDPTSKLIRKMQTRVDGQEMVLEYAYGEPKVRDIYDLGVPRTARMMAGAAAMTLAAEPAVMKVPAVAKLAKDPSGDADALTARIDKRMNADFGDLVMLECMQQQAQGHALIIEGGMTLQGRQGEKRVYASYLALSLAGLMGTAGIPPGWPRPKLEDALLAIKPAKPGNAMVLNGEDFWAERGERVLKDGRAAVTKAEPRAATRPSAGEVAMMRVGPRFWELPGMSLMINGKRAGTIHDELMHDPDRPGLIVLHRETSLPFRMPGGTADHKEDAYYWIDPAHDDLVIESVVRSNSKGAELDTVDHEVMLEFGRLKDGRWYPAHWQQKSFFPPTPGVSDGGYRETWRQIIQDTALPAALYGDPAKWEKGGTKQ